MTNGQIKFDTNTPHMRGYGRVARTHRKCTNHALKYVMSCEMDFRKCEFRPTIKIGINIMKYAYKFWASPFPFFGVFIRNWFSKQKCIITLCNSIIGIT